MEYPFIAPSADCALEGIVALRFAELRFEIQAKELNVLYCLLCGDINYTAGKVSLRLVDWAVTNYSKSHASMYILDGKMFHMHNSYLRWLAGYKRKLFDVFCRGSHQQVVLHCCESRRLVTSVGQLNFFHWAYRHGVLGYIKSKRVEMQADMAAAMSESRKRKRARGVAPRTSLSKGPQSTCGILVEDSLRIDLS
jgi:hypothetical protein